MDRLIEQIPFFTTEQRNLAASVAGFAAREIEPRAGGDAALRVFVQEAHKRGLRVLLDLINNQVHKDHEYVAKNG
nr:hypothetical protein [Acidobacteriota bacterium]